MRPPPPTLRNRRTKKRRRRAEKNNLQVSTTKLQSNTSSKHQTASCTEQFLNRQFDFWSFSGGWMLVVGCSTSVPAGAAQSGLIFPASSAGTRRSNARLWPGYHAPNQLRG